MTPEERTRALRDLAQSITQRGMATPARLTLDVLAPLGFLAGQAAQFARPLLPTERWRNYATALGDEQAWRRLRDLIDC